MATKRKQKRKNTSAKTRKSKSSRRKSTTRSPGSKKRSAKARSGARKSTKAKGAAAKSASRPKRALAQPAGEPEQEKIVAIANAVAAVVAVPVAAAIAAAAALTRKRSTISSPADAVAAIEPERRQLKFKLQNKAPEYVRVTLDGGSELVLLNDQSWPSKPRIKGEEVRVNLEITGAPGQTATIDVENCKPPQISVTLPDNGMDRIEHRAPKTVYADW
jgi:hypothetical protein